jgi:hypothetical protein
MIDARTNRDSFCFSSSSRLTFYWTNLKKNGRRRRRTASAFSAFSDFIPFQSAERHFRILSRQRVGECAVSERELVLDMQKLHCSKHSTTPNSALLQTLHYSNRHCFTYIGSPNGPIQRPNPVRYVQYKRYETTARSETRKLARARPARCPAWRIWP